jgi:hypothetical protein
MTATAHRPHRKVSGSFKEIVSPVFSGQQMFYVLTEFCHVDADQVRASIPTYTALAEPIVVRNDAGQMFHVIPVISGGHEGQFQLYVAEEESQGKGEEHEEPANP